MAVFDVTFKHEEYTNAVNKWTMVEDVCEGEAKVKEKGDTYLPRPNPADKSERNKLRYLGFLARAVFYNATGRTLDGLTGTVFKKDPVCVVPSALDYVKRDVDGKNVSIFQQSQSVLGSVLKKGRHFLFVDYPKTEKDGSKADQKAGLVRASCVSVKAEHVTNWRSEKVGAVYKLSLVVIEESIEEVTEDGFGFQKVKQYRVLKLNEGVYQVLIYRQKNNGGAWEIYDEYIPADGKGKTWDEIPGVFVGAKNNDTDVDKGALLDLATLNLAHYRNSALYEDSVYFVGQAQPYMTGLTEEWRDHLEEQGIEIGSMSLLPLPEGGTFGFAQVDPNTLAKEAMDQKDEQMKGIGARILQKGQAVKTATEAQNENESEHSVLSLVAVNVSEAYVQILEWMARFDKVNGEVEYELNQEFMEQKLDAQMLTAMVAAWQAGRLPSSDYWDRMKEYGMVDPEKDNDELDGEIESDLTLLNLDDEVEEDESITV